MCQTIGLYSSKEAQDPAYTDKTERQSDFTSAKKCNNQTTVCSAQGVWIQSWSTASDLKEPTVHIFIIPTL